MNIFDLVKEDQDKAISEFLKDPEKQIYKSKGGPEMDLPENWQELDSSKEDEE